MEPSLPSPELARRDRSGITLAKPLAPEDIAVGDYVATLHMICEAPSFLWCSDATLTSRDELVLMQFVPDEGAGVPLRVESICLPFVLVQPPTGKQRPLDIRRHPLARLAPGYAQATWKALGKKRKKKRKGKKK